MVNLWRNPLFVWDVKGAVEELPTNPHVSPQSIWDRTRESRVSLLPVGRLRYYYKWPGHGASIWNRLRYWPTRRRLLNIRGEYNPKTMAREKTVVDKRPIWWLLGLLALLVAPFLIPDSLQNTLFAAGAFFGIYAAINLCWMLVLGTASIYSLASFAVVGAAAFVATYLSIVLHLPWWVLPLVGSAVGLIFGVIIAIPATRLDGFYYALLTLGLNELCRVYFLQSKQFGAATGGLYGADTYIPKDWTPLSQSMLGYYACFALMLGALLLYRMVDGRRLGRILRMAPEKREAFAEATGVDYRRARVLVFIISSVALGFIGGFYASHYRGVGFSIFSFDTVLLGLAMLVIGGIGRAEGAVVGTAIVVLLDKVLISWGPIRLIAIGLIMLGVVLFLRGGIFGIKAQFRAWRDKKKSERRSTRAEKGGEMLPEEATETKNKDLVYFHRYDKMQRDYLKTLVSPEIIDEHQRSPLGQHSEALERLLLYFRRAALPDKYAITVVEPFKAYRIVALSGHRGVAPRVVEDKIYPTQDEAYHGVFLRRVQDLLEA
ncbi:MULTISPECIES: branched-chain amino acid ABC transporter permease [unclassified Mesorhizobium]|uniref:branched-chain amino acid ABC transporter permease n=1 Tax=unclassified Mesorhizobium TaxID=325217 RepID=UPI000BB09589|nr:MULTISPECIES: branched-chain amino acid ABC transporter permease [unclassified Mesorhizobium]AZO07709.1 branched-chain amino acid ABC transporter permease [Mesorhizobium sp. M3A.F.Ca.ET.080.04.2.1]PBB84523.1 branched-chain amino acid ABC transporter permease [Mesorhizobium sp. WSM3876]RWF16083.1 MAG: branched-chain amino acid ABC transporter permease [Mesorhizobium sp.]